MCSMARVSPDQSFLSMCHRRHVAGLCTLDKVNSNSNHCLFSELPPAVTRVRYTRATLAAHLLVFKVSICRTSQFSRCFLPAHVRKSNELLYTVFETGTLEGFKEAVKSLLLPRVVFFQFPVAQVLVGL